MSEEVKNIQNGGDEELFEKLNAEKKRKRRRTIRVALIILLAVVGAVALGMRALRRQVEENLAASAPQVQSYAASRGSVSTTVSGSGVLESVDERQLTVPYGVELGEIVVSAGDSVKAGDALATVKMSSVMTALSDTRDEIKQLDDSINTAGSDRVSAYVNAGVAGRVKRICAESGMDVVDCMSEYGALCVLSLDGSMVLEVELALPAGESVTVRCGDGKEYEGRVESSVGGKSRVTLTDNGPVWGERATVLSTDGGELGSGTLEIHSPLSVTGYAGTVNAVYARENQKVYAWSTLFTLSDTQSSANYDALIQSRQEAEARQMELIAMMRTGTFTAPFDGTVLSLDYTAESGAAASYTAATPDETAVFTLAPDEKVCVTLSVDESDILSLKTGQSAAVSVASVGEDTVEGEVTEISRVAVSSSGVTLYSATVTLPRQEGMLPGMTADVSIRIEGVDNAVLIPVDALHRTSSSAYVYTSYDEATGQYGGMVEVTAGVADDDFVEITSGLKEGDTVYYTEKESFDFFMMMGSGGNAARMGEAPQGMAPGGQRPQGGGMRG
ncbi:MAG: HlyD family efflux transporter periplasmic adaptor subunit [bacterium]|nr:HlyD family efflux transporter periplasmic adaptor subunit [bacterium]